MLPHEVGHTLSQPAQVGLLFPQGQLEQHLGGARFVAAYRGIDQFHERITGVSFHGAHYAEIQQADPVIRQDEKIVGVWVGVEEAVFEDLGRQDVRLDK